MQILRRPLVGFAVLGVFAIGVGVAYATQSLTSATTTVINACQLKQIGTIRIVDNLSKCSTSLEIPLSWNVQGPAGNPGPAGATGATGAKGEKGDKGDKGDPGATGAAGQPGAKGDPGTPGATGATGPPGAPGDPGTPGADGKNGVDGTNGVDGKDGKDGTNGVDGAGFNGSYTSPNGKYKLRITNNGILLSGPGGSVSLERTIVRVTDATPWSGSPWSGQP